MATYTGENVPLVSWCVLGGENCTILVNTHIVRMREHPSILSPRPSHFSFGGECKVKPDILKVETSIPTVGAISKAPWKKFHVASYFIRQWCFFRLLGLRYSCLWNWQVCLLTCLQRRYVCGECLWNGEVRHTYIHTDMQAHTTIHRREECTVLLNERRSRKDVKINTTSLPSSSDMFPCQVLKLETSDSII